MPRTSRSARAATLAALVLAVALSACGGGGSGRSPATRAAGGSPAGPLERGEPFPDVQVTGLDSVRVGTASLVRGHETLVLFISTACETCAEMLATWRTRAAEMPPEVKVVLIVDEEVDYAAKYVERSRIPFPLYCDTRSVFSERHKMDIYPTAVGVRADGTIAYVQRGVSQLFTPERAIQILRRMGQAK